MKKPVFVCIGIAAFVAILAPVGGAPVFTAAIFFAVGAAWHRSAVQRTLEDYRYEVWSRRLSKTIDKAACSERIVAVDVLTSRVGQIL